ERDECECANESAGLRHGSLSSFRVRGARYDPPSRGGDTGLCRGGDEVVTCPESQAGSGCTVWAMAMDEALDRVEAQLQEEGQRGVSAIPGAIRALHGGARGLAA